MTANANRSPFDDRFSRLRKWAADWHEGRYERPQYATRGELKADVLRLLAERDRLHEDVQSVCATTTTWPGNLSVADEIFGALKQGDLSVDEAVAAWIAAGDSAFPGVPSDG